jgi:guanylate kinase
VIFIEPPSIEELEKRLMARGTDSIEVIRERIENARKELEKKDKYDHLILNDDVDLAYNKLKAAVQRILS